MPHSEYPSGSACLCTAYAEYTTAFVEGEITANFEWTEIGFRGKQEVGGCEYLASSGSLFQLPESAGLGCSAKDKYTFESMDDLAHISEQSRLWGGMHFTKAAPSAEKLCQGIGLAAYEEVKRLRGGDSNRNWSGSEWFQRNSRPECKDSRK